MAPKGANIMRQGLGLEGMLAALHSTPQVSRNNHDREAPGLLAFVIEWQGARAQSGSWSRRVCERGLRGARADCKLAMPLRCAWSVRRGVQEVRRLPRVFAGCLYERNSDQVP